ncbi:MAG: GGDEF domain-containing protein [Bacilli bacterium]|nr:GGDEF domain-containing protein [Bacilli bacterium]
MSELLLAYATINAVGLSLLLTIYVFMRQRSRFFTLDQHIFVAILAANALILIFDAFMWILDGQIYHFARDFLQPATVIYYILNPVVGMIWLIYVYLQIFGSFKKMRYKWILIFLPFVLNIVLAMLSLKYDLLFYINQDNTYIRGQFFYVESIISFSYLAVAFAIIIIYRKRIKREKVLPLIMYAVPSTIAGIIQVLFYGVSIIWVSTAVASLIVFIGLQSKSLITDHLTGLYNRGHLENYLVWKLSKRDGKKYLSGAMLDIDRFKDINDKFGHIAGDIALEEASQVLLKSVGKKDFIARYAGDEFVIITESLDKDYIENVLKKLEDNLIVHNRVKNNLYDLHFSYGYHVFGPTEDYDFENFINTIDKKMYQNKKEKYDSLIDLYDYPDYLV